MRSKNALSFAVLQKLIIAADCVERVRVNHQNAVVVRVYIREYALQIGRAAHAHTDIYGVGFFDYFVERGAVELDKPVLVVAQKFHHGQNRARSQRNAMHARQAQRDRARAV